MRDFERWLGSLFGHDGDKVQELLGNQTALQFLIAWSLFESKCFDGFVKKEQLEKFSKCTAAKSDFPMKRLERAAHHFHERYQVREHRENLLHGQECAQFLKILEGPISDPLDHNVLFLCVFVVYRFRNNIFHGNKGVALWLQYEEQICFCIDILQALVSYAEEKTPSMKTDGIGT